MRRARFGFVLAAFALVGSLTVVMTATTCTVTPTATEVPLGKLASGSSAGLNGTKGAVTITGTSLQTTTNLWYLNNTSAGTYVAKLSETSASGLSNILALTIGINNGAASSQIVVTAGSLTQTSGSYVTLAQHSTNVIYATESVSIPGQASTIGMNVLVADDSTATALVTMTATLTVQ